MRSQAFQMRRPAAFLALFLAAAAPAAAGEIIVTVSGAGSDNGEIGCGLYAGADGFPMEPDKATQFWQAPDAGGAVCRFSGLAAGTYAVAASHDLNGNRITDTNFLGMPREAWGVSNNIRPSLRAPRFEEAAIDLAEGETLAIEIRLAK